MTPGHLVIVTGPPGAGKSTIARILAETAADPGGVHLHGDDFLTAVRSGFVAPHLPASMHQNRVLSGALAAAGCRFAGGGYLTLLDWVVGPWFLDVYRDEAARAGVPLHYVVLRPTEDAVVARSRDRSAAPIPSYDHLRPLYEQLSRLGDLEAHAVDSTDWSPVETATAVRDGLRTGRFRLDVRRR